MELELWPFIVVSAGLRAEVASVQRGTRGALAYSIIIWGGDAGMRDGWPVVGEMEVAPLRDE